MRRLAIRRLWCAVRGITARRRGAAMASPKFARPTDSWGSHQPNAADEPAVALMGVPMNSGGLDPDQQGNVDDQRGLPGSQRYSQPVTDFRIAHGLYRAPSTGGLADQAG